jgi:hypothetical protein
VVSPRLPTPFAAAPGFVSCFTHLLHQRVLASVSSPSHRLKGPPAPSLRVNVPLESISHWLSAIDEAKTGSKVCAELLTTDRMYHRVIRGRDQDAMGYTKVRDNETEAFRIGM